MQNLYRKARQSLSPTRSPTNPSSQDPLPGLANQPPFPSALPHKFSLPAVLHPTPFRQINIATTPEGLILFPDLEGDSPPPPSKHVLLSWGSNTVIQETAHDPDQIDQSTSVCVVGLLGILDLFHCPYLFVITAKTDVGELYKGSHPVYCVKGVAAIPLANELEAATALKVIGARKPPKPVRQDTALSSVEDVPPIAPGIAVVDASPTSESAPQVRFAPEASELDLTIATSSLMLAPEPGVEVLASGQTTPASMGSRSGSPLSNGIVERLSFWKKKRQTTSDSIETSSSAMSSAPDDTEDDEPPENSGAQALGSLLSRAAPPVTAEEKRTQLEAKIIRDTAREFSRGIFFFSYDFDITRSTQHKHELLTSQHHTKHLLADLGAQSPTEETPLLSPVAEPQSNLPLWRRVDRKFWWNEHISKPFADAGLHNYVLPVMQGYFQIATFHMPNQDDIKYGSEDIPSAEALVKVKYAIISRRSKERAGLRYQRRGIDDQGSVANFVETETIVQIKRQETWNVFSHVQIRGSIPLFWSQPGMNLKPAPVLDRPREQSMDVVRQHFDRIVGIYGPVTAINVAELTGKESAVTAPYREAVAELKNPQASYQEFDFHRECAGMHYENINKLVTRLERTFESQGFFWVSGSIVLSKQKGAFRVNCIDCLDRTNVVMSAFSRHVLLSQLEAVALIQVRAQANGTEMDTVFNDVWANNGDAVSRAYAGTSALKGDFTRTGRRDLGGILNDGMNSVMRMYSSTFSDYFSQACIDYMLGNRTTTVFSEFLLKLSATDPKEMIRLSKIRAAAIETSGNLVLYKGETLIHGWTLMAPLELNTKIGHPFVEKVLLLSAQALYVVNFDYSMLKVKMYTRVPLGDITSIQKGPYILSALQEASRNTVDNYGFIVNFQPRQTATRITSYALRNQASAYPAIPKTPPPEEEQTPSQASSKISAKGSILSNVLSAATMGPSEHLFAAFKAIPDEIERETRGADNHDEFVAANPGKNCKQAVDSIVNVIKRACATMGNDKGEDFILEKDVLSLAEAQRLASIYSKFEYGFKRLLWLGVP